MLSAEKKSLIQFVGVFVALNTIFLLILSVMYYYYQKNVYLEVRRNSMIFYSGKVYEHLYNIDALNQIDDRLLRDPRFDVALLSSKKGIIYSSVPNFEVVFQKGFSNYKDELFYIESIELAKLKKPRYIAIRTKDITYELEETRETIYTFLGFSILFFAIVIYALSNLFLRPMKEYITKLDNFIRDTTHELNTPLSVIAMSLERIEGQEMTPAIQRSVERMKVATRTMNHLYHDLTFLLLYQKDQERVKACDIGELVLERIDYFRPLAEAKGLGWEEMIEEGVIHVVDRTKLTRVVDNLLSNAIKYNKRKGVIRVNVTPTTLAISDTGIGIAASKIHEIFDRYSRFDHANGGFGIGLNIVQLICKEYGIAIDVNSVLGEGTTFTLRWANKQS